MAKTFVLGFSATVLAELNFLIMGDWGGAPVVGSTPGETATAKAMGIEAVKLGASFSLALGDNFYLAGIQTDEFDSRFQSTFENVFTADSLKSPSFFRVIAGNHDHKGNTTAQVAYSTHSDRWHYPSLYYSFVEQVDNTTTAEFVMIDTVTLSGPSACPVSDEEFQGSDPRMEETLDKEGAQTQYQWLEATLAASTADFLFVSGHYPVWSVCEHGPTQSLVDTLKPLMEKYKVSAYFAGHDHCQQHIDDGAGVQYHVVGAANLHQHSDKNRDKVPSDQLKYLDLGTLVLGYTEGAFASVQIASKEAGAVVAHYLSSAMGYSTKYTAPAIPARSTALVV
jgi:hypothetical protein